MWRSDRRQTSAMKTGNCILRMWAIRVSGDGIKKMKSFFVWSVEGEDEKQRVGKKGPFIPEEGSYGRIKSH